MKTIVCDKPGSFSVVERPEPKLEQGKAIVRIRRVGICGTDLHAFRGDQPYFTYPRVLGHELSGEIAEIGPNERGLKAGDAVVVIALPNLLANACAF